MSSIHTVFQVCTICLDTDSKLYVMSEYKMDKAYEYLTGLS
ncbi:jg25286, partial [Pararge aegeria aegeria]